MTLTIDNRTAAQVELLAAELNITPAAVIGRAVQVLSVARRVQKGIEIDRRNKSEPPGEDFA